MPESNADEKYFTKSICAYKQKRYSRKYPIRKIKGIKNVDTIVGFMLKYNMNLQQEKFYEYRIQKSRSEGCRAVN